MDIYNIILVSVIVMLLFLSVNKQLNENFQKQNPYLNEILEDVYEVFPDSKKLRFYEGEKSYTLNKEKVFICMKDKKNGQYYEKNILMYVILHEYTHSICPEIGHTKLFFQMFDDVLKKAVNSKIYDPSVDIPDNYCE